MKRVCKKCGYIDEKNKEKFGVYLCSICYSFSPNDESSFKEYISEKIDWKILETFRKYMESPKEKLKQGMIEKASQGNVVSRAPFGYKIVNKKLVPAENWREVEEIFEEFLKKDMSLTKLAKKHNFSVNGLKKILTNFTYIGKVKFNGQIHQGNHQPLISHTLFNHVQNKLSKILKKSS